jgi:hypothetical protein
MLSSYPGWIKLPYFADLTQREDRGWKEAQRQGEDRVTLMKTLLRTLEKAPIQSKLIRIGPDFQN